MRKNPTESYSRHMPAFPVSCLLAIIPSSPFSARFFSFFPACQIKCQTIQLKLLSTMLEKQWRHIKYPETRRTVCA